MIRKGEVWFICCNKCDSIIESCRTEEKALQRVSDGSLKHHTCTFCGEIVCSDCMLDVSIDTSYLPICKDCASKHTILELKNILIEAEK